MTVLSTSLTPTTDQDAPSHSATHNVLGLFNNNLNDYTVGKQSSFATYDGQVNQMLHGSDVSPVITAGPSVKISRVETISSVVLPNPADSEGTAALLVTSASISTSTRAQVTAIMAEAYSNSDGAAGGYADSCAVVAIGYTDNANGYGIGGYIEGRALHAAGHGIGLEVRVANETGSDDSYVTSGASNLMGIWLNSNSTTGKDSGAGIQFGPGLNSSQFAVGIGFNAGGIKNSSIRDDSSALVSYKDAGTHTTGIDQSGASISTWSAYLKATNGNLALDNRNAGEAANINFLDATVNKWIIGKQSDNTFIIYDAVGTHILAKFSQWTAAANETGFFLAEGITPTIRQVKWVDPGNLGVNFTAGQRVMVLV